MESDAGVSCLFCCSSVDTRKQGEVDSIGFSTYEALEVTFAELCSLLHISFPSKWKSWDFENEPFPFCNQCHGEIATVCDLSDQVKLIQNNLNSILMHLTATALQSVHPKTSLNDETGDKVAHIQQRNTPANKHEFFRESIIKSYTPVLIMQPLKGTSASRSLIKPLTDNLHDETTQAEQEDSDSYSCCIDTEPFDDVPDLLESSVSIKVEDSLPDVDDSNSCCEEELAEEREMPTLLKERKRPDKVEIKVEDEATKMFSFSGFKFQEVNNNFKCLTCSKVCLFRKDRKKSSTAYYEYIRLHITRAHIEPKSPATVPVKKKPKTDSDNKLTPVERAMDQSTSDALPVQPRMSSAHLSVKAEEIENHSKVSVNQVSDKKKDNHPVSASVSSIGEEADQAVHDESNNFGSIQDAVDPPDPDSDFSPAEVASAISVDVADSDSSDQRPKSHSKNLPRTRSSLQGVSPKRDAKYVQSTRANEEGRSPKVSTTGSIRRQKGSNYTSKLLDEDTKTYSMGGYKFQELEDAFKCLTCQKVIKARLGKGNGKIRFEYIENHVRKLHIGNPKKGPVATIVDEETKTYSTLGFQFQQVESGDFKCLVCGNLIKPFNQGTKEHWRSPFTNMKKHMARTHKTVTPENLHGTVSNIQEHNFLKEFEASSSSAPKPDTVENLLGCEENSLAENNSLKEEKKERHSKVSVNQVNDTKKNDHTVSASVSSISEEAGQATDDESHDSGSIQDPVDPPDLDSDFSPAEEASENSDDDAGSNYSNERPNTRSKGSPRKRSSLQGTADSPAKKGRHSAGQVELVDETSKIYAFSGFQFQEVDTGYKCLTCPVILKSRNRRHCERFEYIKTHVKRMHLTAVTENGRRKSFMHEVQVVDEATKVYSINGYKVQRTINGFWCFTCNRVYRTRKTPGFMGKFYHIRRHVKSSHQGDPGAMDKKRVRRSRKREVSPTEWVKTYKGITYNFKLLDEDTKTYSMEGYKFQEFENFFECLTCQKVIKAQLKSGKQRFEFIKNHVILMHLEPSKGTGDTVADEVGPSTLVDSSANIHEYQGFHFQGVDEHYQCLKCKELGSSSADQVYKSFASIRKHIWDAHKKDKMSPGVRLVHQQMQTYTYKGCEFADLDEKGLECVICKAVRDTGASMVDHIIQEHKEPVERQCQICSFKYMTATKLRDHFIKVHMQDRTRAICETCGRSFRNRMYLNKHVRSMHSERLHACGKCDKKFATPSDLRNHILSVHEGLRSFVCEVCGKGFYDAYQLRYHQRIHASDKSYVCDQCGKAFTQRPCLNRHLLMVHKGYKLPQKYPCDICGKKYQTRYSVKLHHREVHLGLRPKRIRDSKTRKTIRTIKPQERFDESRDVSINSVFE